MKCLNLVTIAVVTTSLLAAPAVYAAPANISSPVHAMFSKSKTSTVKLNVRNDSGSAMEIKVGDKVMTLDPGKPVSLNLEVGTRIVANTATPNHPAGSLIEEVIKDHDGATIVIH
jgi:PKD repeat protein